MQYRVVQKVSLQVFAVTYNNYLITDLLLNMSVKVFLKVGHAVAIFTAVMNDNKLGGLILLGPLCINRITE